MSDQTEQPQRSLAERVREACRAAAAQAYQDAATQGLCEEGRWEAALGAIQRLDLSAFEPAAAGGDTAEPTPDPIVLEFRLQESAGAAFKRFAERFNTWWPAEYTWSGAALEWIGIEPHAGGRCTERGPRGFQCDWGRVLLWDPPQRLRLAWQISPRREPEPDPARASTVEVRFEPGPSGQTTLRFEHRDFQRHGAGAAAYRAALASPQGWPWILQRFVSGGTER